MVNLPNKYMCEVSECSLGGEDGITPLVQSHRKIFNLDKFALEEIFKNEHIQFQTIDALLSTEESIYYIEFKGGLFQNIKVKQLEGKIVGSLIIMYHHLNINVFDSKDKIFVLVVNNNLERIRYLFSMTSVGSSVEEEIKSKRENILNAISKYSYNYFKLYKHNGNVKAILSAKEFKTLVLKE